MTAVKKHLFVIGFLSLMNILPLSVMADTLTVKLDGTGNYTSIQNAIGYSSDGDVILIWPGIYYENVDLYGRDSLTIASLYLIDPQDSLINQTIIDGNQTGSCILAFWEEKGIVIEGLTIRNGYGTDVWSGANYGGGIQFFTGTTGIIRNCIITNNSAKAGGGIAFGDDGEYTLTRVKICYNHAYGFGGGIYCGGNAVINFDSIDRCDLFLNYAGLGSDFAQGYTGPLRKLYLDTATVSQPDHYYISSYDQLGFQTYLIDWDIEHAKIEAINSDIYVSPTGDNNNAGLSPDQPLKDLSFAMLKIVSDSTKQNTIHLSDGIYVPSNGEKFPLNLKSFVPIIGESMDNTVIDLENMTTFGRGNSGEKELIIKNLSIINGRGRYLSPQYSTIEINYSNYLRMDSLSLRNCTGDADPVALTVVSSDSALISNSEFTQNKTIYCIYIYNVLKPTPCFYKIESCKIKNNFPDPNTGWKDGLTVATNGPESSDSVALKGIIMNSEITNNLDSNSNPGFPATCGIAISRNANVRIINSTIGDNRTINSIGGSIGIAQKSKVELYNSIIYGNIPKQFLLYYTYTPDEACDLYLYNCLVQDGENGINSLSPYHYIYYDSTNLDADPLWDTAGTYPYFLTEDSPCIDAGTLDLPPGIELPAYDILGNPRVWGESVDMGAYEYGPWVKLPEVPGLQFPARSQCIQISPNPFTNGTYVKYEAPENGNLNISVFDLNGKLVTTLVDSNSAERGGELYWDGTSKTGYKTPAGIYIIKLTINDKVKGSVKVIKEK